MGIERQNKKRENPTESIRAAALEHNGEVFEGPAHFDAYLKLQEKYPNIPWDEDASHNYRDGFTTSQGRFVDRREAAKIASAADQLREEDKNDTWISAEWLKREGE